MLSTSVKDNLKALADWICVFIGTLGADRVKDVADRGDSTFDRNFFARKTVWVSGAIPFFVVGFSDKSCQPHDRRAAFVNDVLDLTECFSFIKFLAADNSAAGAAVILHRIELIGCQALGLVQDDVRNSDLANVVQLSRMFEIDHLLWGESKFTCNDRGVSAHADNVFSSKVVTQFGSPSETLDCFAS